MELLVVALHQKDKHGFICVTIKKDANSQILENTILLHFKVA